MMVRRTAVVAGALVTALMLAACGGGDDDDAATGEDPPAETAEAGQSEAGGGGDFCADLQAVVAGNVEIMTTVINEAPVTIETVIDEAGALYPGMAEAAVASAPSELQADVVTVTAATTDMIEALAAADLGAPGAASTALESVPFGEDVDAAADRLSEYARTECGFDPDAIDSEVGGATMPTAAEPPDACEFVDPQLVADAAGLPVDVADEDGGADVDLGIYATKACSYGNGSMSISTITYGGDVAEVAQSFVDSAEDNGGRVVTDADLGGLPASTVLTEVHGFLSIHVLEAPVGFSVGFEGNDDPAAVVAAAEAVLAATS